MNWNPTPSDGHDGCASGMTEFQGGLKIFGGGLKNPLDSGGLGLVCVEDPFQFFANGAQAIEQRRFGAHPDNTVCNGNDFAGFYLNNAPSHFDGAGVDTKDNHCSSSRRSSSMSKLLKMF